MATGFHIELGYISGYACEMRQEDAWNLLEKIVKEIRNDYTLICRYVTGKPLSSYDGYPLSDFAKVYHEDAKGTPLMYTYGDDSEKTGFLIMCSSGGASRVAKEIMARAFVLALMTECHKQGIDVSITVA